ncbi:hypothetical protein E2C01_088127 [Portunus trituberculatus]|uniref:Transmembrane protein n=1 Tax=Portunus trituberculatus TaxID=210409 RepID=A0A5B7J9X9_PORTR|nr:hypothetical protein [Portunus trituberculatus]
MKHTLITRSLVLAGSGSGRLRGNLNRRDLSCLSWQRFKTCPNEAKEFPDHIIRQTALIMVVMIVTRVIMIVVVIVVV